MSETYSRKTKDGIHVIELGYSTGPSGRGVNYESIEAWQQAALEFWGAPMAHPDFFARQGFKCCRCGNVATFQDFRDLRDKGVAVRNDAPATECIGRYNAKATGCDWTSGCSIWPWSTSRSPRASGVASSSSPQRSVSNERGVRGADARSEGRGADLLHGWECCKEGCQPGTGAYHEAWHGLVEAVEHIRESGHDVRLVVGPDPGDATCTLCAPGDKTCPVNWRKKAVPA